MSEHSQDIVQCGPGQTAMSIHTRKITDSCRDKDCIEDLPVFLSASSQALLDSGSGTRVRSAELISSYIDVEPVAFDRCHYCIDITFYYRILADTIIGISRPATLCGLAVFTKRAVLCGEDSSAHIYRSDTRLYSPDGLTRSFANRPTAVVEALDPMVLGSKIREPREAGPAETAPVHVPQSIREMFDEELSICPDHKRLFVTLGQFSIVRLERDAQLIVPVLNYAIPTKECCDNPGCTEDPCEMFSRIPFPAEQFAPKACDKKKPCD